MFSYNDSKVALNNRIKHVMTAFIVAYIYYSPNCRQLKHTHLVFK